MLSVIAICYIVLGLIAAGIIIKIMIDDGDELNLGIFLGLVILGVITGAFGFAFLCLFSERIHWPVLVKGKKTL